MQFKIYNFQTIDALYQSYSSQSNQQLYISQGFSLKFFIVPNICFTFLNFETQNIEFPDLSCSDDEYQSCSGLLDLHVCSW